MKSVYLNIKSEGTFFAPINENISMPEIVRLGQYTKEIIQRDEYNKKKIKSPKDFLIGEILSDETNKKEIGYIGNGAMGNSTFDFSVDCRHWSIPYDNETKNFKWINENLRSRYYPTFRKRDILSRFYIIEISDYGNQSLSHGYRDFVPHIYFNGKKLWNRYVGLIRHYSNHSVYILIDKNENNLSIPDFSTETIKKIDIRICFKNNIEISPLNFNEETPLLEWVNTDTEKEYVDKTDFEFNEIKKTFTNLNISDYDFYFFKSSEGKYYEINPIIFSNLDISRNIIDENTVDINQQSSSSSFDFYKDMYFKTYYHDNNSLRYSDYTRNVKTTLKLILKHNTFLRFNPGDKLLLTSKSNRVEAFYNYNDNTTLNANSEFSNENIMNKIKNTTDYIIYKEDGTAIIDTKTFIYADTEKYECIPEYDSSRKLIFKISNCNNNKLRDILYNLPKNKQFYRWNLINPEVLSFSNEGNYNGRIEYEENIIDNTDYFIFYDRGEDEFDINVDADSKPVNLIDENNNFDITYIEKYLPPNEFDISSGAINSQITLTGITDAYSEINLGVAPISFYIDISSNESTDSNQKKLEAILNKVNFYIVARSFPIKYEGYIYDEKTLYFRLPQYIYDNLNKDIVNSMENILFIEGANSADCSSYIKGLRIYDIHYYSEEKFLKNIFDDNKNSEWSDSNMNGKYNKDKGMYNLNILNFSERNNPNENQTI